MGKACSSSKEDPADELENRVIKRKPVQVSSKYSERYKDTFLSNSCKTSSTNSDKVERYIEDSDENFGIDKPELGIYDTRAWDSLYLRWLGDPEGPNPGKHPDPNCVWNTDQELFDFDKYSEQ